ncbi:MAG: Crp/Fnr family transcriptional regulator [Bacteroidota bacterium]
MAYQRNTLEISKFKKGEILQYKGELNSKVYIVKKGLLRSYNIDKKGKEHIFMFAPEGWTMGDACTPESPCELFIDALEDCEIMILKKDIDRDSKPKSFQALVKRMLVLQRRVIMMMSVSAIERYEHFEQTYPELIQRVPQKMIASYLGITPEALSKIRGERLRKK